MNKLEALNEVMTTNLRIKNEGLELHMPVFNIKTSRCGTICCVAGWHTVFEGCGDDHRHSTLWTRKISRIVSGDEGSKRYDKVWAILFGQGRPDDIDKQIYVTRWFIRREEALQEYNRIRAMPRKERRLLNLAA